MFSSARMGRPAATRPMSGRPNCSRMVSFSWMPREVPGTRAITPLRARARRCSSAALAERNPSSRAISARVGGMPVSEMQVWIRRRISVWRGVRSDMSVPVYLYRYCDYIQIDPGRKPDENRPNHPRNRHWDGCLRHVFSLFNISTMRSAMAIVNFSVPDDVKAAFDKAFGD